MHMTNLKTMGNVAITGAMQEHIDKKFGKVVDNANGQVTSVKVHFNKNGNSTDAFKFSAEVNVKGATFYAEERGDTGEEFYHLVDAVVQQIERQMNKRKVRFEAEKRKSSIKRSVELTDGEDV